jgi:hypothetical protein
MSSTQHLHSALGDIPTDEFEAALDADQQPTLLGLGSSNGPEPPSNPGRFIAGAGGPPFAPPNGRSSNHRPNQGGLDISSQSQRQMAVTGGESDRHEIYTRPSTR